MWPPFVKHDRLSFVPNTPDPWNEQFCPLKNTPGPQKDKKVFQPSIFRCYVSFREGRLYEICLNDYCNQQNGMVWTNFFNSKRLLHELWLDVTRHVSKYSIYQGIIQKNDLKFMCCEWVNIELVLNRFTHRLHHRLAREFKNGSSFGGYFKTILTGWEREKRWKWTLDFGENSILHPLKREKALKNSWKMLEDYGIVSS